MRASTTLRAGRLAQSLSRPLWQAPAAVRLNSRSHSTAVETPLNFGAAPPPPPQQQKSGLDGKKLLADAVAATKPRNNWTREEIAAIYYQPLLELTYQSVRTATNELHEFDAGLQKTDDGLCNRELCTVASTALEKSSYAPS